MTMTDWRTLTAEAIAALPLDQAQTLYPRVRADLAREYEECGPMAARRAARRAQALRSAASTVNPRRALSLSQRADREIDDLDARRDAYDAGTLVKHLLAVRIGNLDSIILSGRQTMTCGDVGDWDQALRVVTAVRAAEIGAPPPTW